MNKEQIAELKRTTHERLNVGCGQCYMHYYVNLDSDPDVKADIHADAIEYLKTCAGGQYKEIWASHFLEHLPFEAATVFLAECYRVLAPGGWLRVVVPDTRIIMQRWLAGDPEIIEVPRGQLHPIADLDHICMCFLHGGTQIQKSWHEWCWEYKTLARAMHRAGFENIVELDRYFEPRLNCGTWFQTGCGGQKPKGVENA